MVVKCQQPGCFHFHPVGEPFALAAHIQDWLEEWSCLLRGDGPTYVGQLPLTDFGYSDDGCEGFFVLQFKGDNWRVAWDNGAVGEEVIGCLQQLVEDHEALMCAVRGCSHREHRGVFSLEA
jgi:hypothetical protein